MGAEVERETTISISDLVSGREKQLGLQLENSNSRRTIYSINDPELFLSKSSLELNIGYVVIPKIKEAFSAYPNGLKQLFLISGDNLVLGNHYHTKLESEGGTGKEVFVFASVAPDAQIKVEQYHLGRAKGLIRYGLKTGAIVQNNPNDYHVFTISGDVALVQVTESSCFDPDDLKKFSATEWSDTDNRMINGTL